MEPLACIKVLLAFMRDGGEPLFFQQLPAAPIPAAYLLCNALTVQPEYYCTYDMAPGSSSHFDESRCVLQAANS